LTAAALKLPAGSGGASAEVFAGGDAELGEDVAKVPLDGARANEQLGGDLLVCLPVPGQPGDLGLLADEVGEGLDGALAHGFPGGRKLAAGALGEAVGADAAEHLIGRTQGVARILTPVLAAQPFAVKEVGAGQVHGDTTAAEPADRLPVQSIGGLAVAQQRA